MVATESSHPRCIDCEPALLEHRLEVAQNTVFFIPGPLTRYLPKG